MRISDWSSDVCSSDLELQQPARRLGDASDTDSEALAAMPERARLIIEASCDLYQRIKRLADEMMRNGTVPRPARSLQIGRAARRGRGGQEAENEVGAGS